MAILLHNTPLARLHSVYKSCRGQLCDSARAIPGVDAHMAEDAVQEAWLRLTDPDTLAGLDTADPQRLKSLLFLTVRNTARNLRRHAAYAEPQQDEIMAGQPAAEPGPAEQAERRDAAEALWRAVDRLREPERSIILLQYGQACTARQIAALLGMSEENVRQRARRARGHLKAQLEQEGLFDE